MTDDPRLPFYDAEEAHRARVAALLRGLSGEELADLYELFDLFGKGNHATEVPYAYWGASYRVRAAIQVEIRRRNKEK